MFSSSSSLLLTLRSNSYWDQASVLVQVRYSIQIQFLTLSWALRSLAFWMPKVYLWPELRSPGRSWIHSAFLATHSLRSGRKVRVCPSAERFLDDGLYTYKFRGIQAFPESKACADILKRRSQLHSSHPWLFHTVRSRPLERRNSSDVRSRRLSD